jgi:hypothetical protein
VLYCPECETSKIESSLLNPSGSSLVKELPNEAGFASGMKTFIKVHLASFRNNSSSSPGFLAHFHNRLNIFFESHDAWPRSPSFFSVEQNRFLF